MPTFIDDICRQELDITIRQSRRINDGNSKETWALVTEDGDIIYFHQGTDRLRDEVALMRRIRQETPIPVAPILAAGVAHHSFYFITAEISGDSLDTQITRLAHPKLHNIVTTFGRYLGIVQNLRSWKHHGPLSIKEDVFEVTPSYSGSSFLEVLWQNNMETMPPELKALCDRIEQIIDWQGMLEPVAAYVYPWDFRPGNMISDAGELVGVLDWGEPIAAPASLGYAKVEYICLDWFGLDHLRRHFRAGYESVRSVEWSEEEYAISRLVAIIHSGVDRNGDVTRPGYPLASETEALIFHSEKLKEATTAI